MRRPSLSEVLIQRAIHIANDSNRTWAGNVQVPDLLRDLVNEIDRLNNWADGFSDAQLKERELAEAVIRALSQSRADLLLALTDLLKCVQYASVEFHRDFGGTIKDSRAIIAKAGAAS